MKLIIIFFTLIFSLGSCEIILDSILKDARPIAEDPEYQSAIAKIVGENRDGNRKGARVVNGLPAKMGQFPYQALLFITKQNQMYQCGGNFVHSKWIVTAAHCLKGASSVQIYGGVVSLSGTYKYKAVVTTKSHIIVHSLYNSMTLKNDIGMVYLESPIHNITDVAPIALPGPVDDFIDLSGKTGIISGFGRFNDTQNSNILRYANVPIITNKQCAEFFGSSITNKMVCISSSSGYSTCQGDSGGPLAVELISGKKTLVGITSFGGVSCDRGYPAGFTRVTSYLPWINKNLSSFK